MKVWAVAACIVLTVMIVAPIKLARAGTGPVMNTIQYRFFDSEVSLFEALLTPDSKGGIDIMGWPLIKDQYDMAIKNPGICVAPYYTGGDFELGFNSNWTNVAHANGRSAMNYTDFRQALACLVDKDGVIAGPRLQGFATRCDTQIPQPLMSAYVNPAVSYPNYPWEYNVTNALYILYRGGWYNHTLYPTFPDLLSAYYADPVNHLKPYAGTAQGVVYPSVDPYGQRDGTDTYVNPRAGQPIDKLQGCISTNDAREDLGNMFSAELDAIGISYNNIYYYPFRVVAIRDRAYDYATFGYNMRSPPNWWYSTFTPAGIYPDGPNPYMVDNANMTRYAYACLTDPNETQYMSDLMAVQDILVNEAYLVSVYSPATYCAYKTSMLGMINEPGCGFEGQGAWYGAFSYTYLSQLLTWVTMNCKKNNTITYNGDPAATPDTNTIYYGTYNPPDMVNPIFGNMESDFQVLGEIFTYPLATNPTNTMVPGSALTGFPGGGDLPWMAYAWKLETINDPANATGLEGDSNVTLWFRHDITWHDGVPFTVDDVNYTIYVNALYGDSWDNAAMMQCVNQTTYAPYFQKWDNWTCSIQVSTPGWLSLYTPLYEIVPEHLYKYIVPSNLTAAELGTSTDGLHGVWPGQAATQENFLSVPSGAPGDAAYINYGNVSAVPDYTLVGTGPWKYRPGSTDATLATTPGGRITLDAYSGFWADMRIVRGEIDFTYTWLNTDPSAQPSGGYYKIGLADLVMLANAYGAMGTPPSAVPILGGRWNPGADLAAPSGVVGLTDLVTLALHYGWYWGNYSYNAPYPAAERANPP
jgi:ABC-type transport system substrate-binding protein